MNQILIAVILLGESAGKPAEERPLVRIGSKAFTESAILGEMASLLAEHRGFRVKHVKELGTAQAYRGLLEDELDVYVEYTGTMREEIFAGEHLPDNEALRQSLAKDGIKMLAPFGFNNTYAIGMTEQTADFLGIENISDLKEHPKLSFAFSIEFMERSDGWPNLKLKYDLPQTKVRGLEHALAYDAVVGNNAQATDVYSTDASVKRYNLRVLHDDLEFFPKYHALFIYREDLADRAPKFIAEVKKLEGKIDDAQMLVLNQKVELYSRPEQVVAQNFIIDNLGLQVEAHETGLAGRIAHRTAQHLLLVSVSLFAAIFIAVPLGVVAAKKPVAGQLIVGTAEIIQTIPGLALLIVFAVLLAWMSLPTFGPLPVILALFMYSLLPIIRNTMTGLTDVPNSLKESAEALGLTPWARLRLIELPMASRMILAGIKTTAVINVGYAALGGLIGAGGYGEPIMAGLRLRNNFTMMEGAIPAACLALCVKWIFELSEPHLVPKGLRLEKTV